MASNDTCVIHFDGPAESGLIVKGARNDIARWLVEYAPTYLAVEAANGSKVLINPGRVAYVSYD